jgi:histone-arginine methyltransferase CARM1
LIYSTVQRWLTTAPGAPTTHWYQLRCVLSQPIYVMAGQEITGRLHMIAHNAQSYTIYLTLSSWFLSSLLFLCRWFVSLVFLTSSTSPAKMWGPGAEQEGILQTSSCKLDLKEPYYRMSQPQAYPLAQDQQQHQLISTQVLANPVIAFLSFRYMILVRSLS